jgi:hypothetical protein
MIRYIETLELPEPPARRGAEAQGPPAAFQSGAQALAIGPQLTEFSNKVPQSIRPAISNGLLLGQLAADKATLGRILRPRQTEWGSCNAVERVVEPDGIEPTTSSMPLKRSPN